MYLWQWISNRQRNPPLRYIQVILKLLTQMHRWWRTTNDHRARGDASSTRAKYGAALVGRTHRVRGLETCSNRGESMRALFLRCKAHRVPTGARILPSELALDLEWQAGTSQRHRWKPYSIQQSQKGRPEMFPLIPRACHYLLDSY